MTLKNFGVDEKCWGEFGWVVEIFGRVRMWKWSFKY